MIQPHFISAIGTPQNDDENESLHVDGLAAHLADQFDHGASGVLVAGTMGLMQLLTDETYHTLVRHSVELCAGRGELLVGVGDCSTARTIARIRQLNEHKLDGVVALTPYFVRFSQPELIDYFRALADVSRAPLYLYDLPQRTGSKIDFATAVTLAAHPNIHGIKCSDEPSYARELMDELGPDFRVVIAQPALADAFLRFGIEWHLDGMFAIAPQWADDIGRAAQRGDWTAAAAHQRQLNGLRRVLPRYGVFQTMTAILNARDIPGNFGPRPHRALDRETREAVLAEPVVQALLADAPVTAPAAV